MKTITKHTILKQGDKVYQPKEVDGVIYWVDKKANIEFNIWVYNDGEVYKSKGRFIQPTDIDSLVYKIVAQSSPILESIPVISLDSYVERLSLNLGLEKYFGGNYDFENGVRVGFKSNPNKWTDEDLFKAIDLAHERIYGLSEILEKTSSINEIEVDENFNVINFK